MSASLVRKALDATTLVSEERLDNLSKASKKKFKPRKKPKKLDKDRVLKNNLKILKALDCKGRITSNETSVTPTSSVPKIETSGKPKKSQSKQNRKQTGSVFSEEDFEKFEKEYFVTT